MLKEQTPRRKTCLPRERALAKQEKKEILSFTKTLMSYPTTDSNLDKQVLCVDEIEKKFKNDFFIKRYSFRGRPAIVLSNTREKVVDIIISGHIDVVPGNKSLFIPKVKKTRLCGRGAYDMKGSVAASIFAVKNYIKNNKINGVKIALFITSDEELDGYSTDQLLSQKEYKAKFAIVPDGGGETNIVLKQKGFYQIKVVVPGKSVHASKPWRGDNPITKSVSLYEHLVQKFPLPKKNKDWLTSITLTKIKTENNINQIPEYAATFFDIRYVKKSHTKEIVKEIKKTLGGKVVVETIAENGVFSVSVKQGSPYIKILAESIQKINRSPFSFIIESSTSDAIFFDKNNIPAVLFRPKGGSEHQSDEWVNINSLYRFHDTLLDFLTNFTS